MKITKQYLKQIISEAINEVISPRQRIAAKQPTVNPVGNTTPTDTVADSEAETAADQDIQSQTTNKLVDKSAKQQNKQLERQKAAQGIEKIINQFNVYDMKGKEAARQLKLDAFIALRDPTKPAVIKIFNTDPFFYKIPADVKINFTFNPNDTNSVNAIINQYKKYRAYKLIPKK